MTVEQILLKFIVLKVMRTNYIVVKCWNVTLFYPL